MDHFTLRDRNGNVVRFTKPASPSIHGNIDLPAGFLMTGVIRADGLLPSRAPDICEKFVDGSKTDVNNRLLVFIRKSRAAEHFQRGLRLFHDLFPIKRAAGTQAGNAGQNVQSDLAIRSSLDAHGKVVSVVAAHSLPHRLDPADDATGTSAGLQERDHFTPFGARVTPPPVIKLRSASPFTHNAVVALWLVSVVLATLSIGCAAGLSVSRLVEFERAEAAHARV